jgi:hypothetical protein
VTRGRDVDNLCRVGRLVERRGLGGQLEKVVDVGGGLRSHVIPGKEKYGCERYIRGRESGKLFESLGRRKDRQMVAAGFSGNHRT